MARFARFEDIDAWKAASRLTVEIYQLTNQGEFCKDWGLRDQARRAASSIPANIAEGFERDTPREFIRFLRIAKGSAGELRTYLYIARTLNYLDENAFHRLLDEARHISAMIANLISYLASQENV